MPVICIEGMRFTASIGCYPEEKLLGNEIEVSLKVLTVRKPGHVSDDLSQTLNYEQIYTDVKDVVSEPMNLLETAALRIIDAIASNHAEAMRIKVSIAKHHPPIPGRVRKVWVEETGIRS